MSSFYESRITVAAHQFLSEALRFRNLNEHRSALIASARNTILDFYRDQRFIFGRMVIEKEPLEPIAFPRQDYREYLDSIRLIFPDSKLIFIHRNVYNTVWSMTRRTWGGSLAKPTEISLTIEEGARIWHDNEQIIESYRGQPNVQVIRYEELVDTPAQVTKELCDFLGIKIVSPFQTRPGKTPGFTEDEIQRIHVAIGQTGTAPPAH